MILSFKMALRSISAGKMRAALTMLGIIIGVMALVVLVSLVNGATSSVTDKVSALGSSMVTANISDDKGNPVTLDTLNGWMEEPELGTLAPLATSIATGRSGGESASFTVYGTTAGYYDVQNIQLFMGRWLKEPDIENHSYVCVLNENAAQELIGYTDCVGRSITLNNVPFTIVGILADDEDSLTSLFSSGSCVAYIPHTSLVRLSDTVSAGITTFYASAPEGGTVDQAKEKLEELMLLRFDEDDDAFSLSSSSILEETMSNVTSVLSILLGGIAAISLIVGGIGIMNIMLVTVTERTREIGIRKAIGATRGVILAQFLMEAVVLCMMGCGLGIFLSWAILQTVSTVVASVGLRFTLDGGVVLISVVFCFLIGVIFGLYPANKAARMKPIDALHYGG